MLFLHQGVTRRWVCAALPLLVVACAPALNWRDFRPDGAPLALAMPCKPSTFARQVALAETSVALHLSACRAGDVTWALAHADMSDPRRVPPALAELARSAADNHGAQIASRKAFHRPGFTPQPEAGQFVLKGRLPDGTAVQTRVAVFAIGTRVFQATAVAAATARGVDEGWETFVSSLRTQP